MDLFCSGCAEPWDIDTVLHDNSFDFNCSIGVIRECPACADIPDNELSLDEHRSYTADVARVLGEALGDDVDGIAAEMEDLGL